MEMGKAKINQSRILGYILDSGEVSKAQIAKELNLSMPTVLQTIKTLSEHDVIKEVGVYESTGGRKAKAIAVNEEYRYAIGLDITKNHIEIVLINMCSQVIKSVRKKKVFQNSIEYCKSVSEEVEDFIEESEVIKEKILGVGISLPGIINYEERILIKSHALELENISLKNLENAMNYPVYFENDANAALLAEKMIENDSVMYLSLSDTVGGAVCLEGKLFRGNKQRAGEFGHMILFPEGRRCYCGKKGCVDAYCSALLLKTEEDMSLEQFMEGVKNKDSECVRIWNEYINHLALVIVNLRMALDIDVILGGYVGHFLKNYMVELETKISEENIFDNDVSFLRSCIFRREVSAVGVAKYFIKKYVNEVQFV